MSYQLTLEKAGAEILGFHEIGSYQGTWGAVVIYKGEKSLVTGSYGSCTYCDAFQSEFGYHSEPYMKDGKYFNGYYDEISKEDYEERMRDLEQKYIYFGEGYLRNPMSKDMIITYLSKLKKDDWFDSEEAELYEWALKFFEE
jgi:hypothetical protein